MVKKVILSELYNEIISESVSREGLMQAMENRKRISIYYDSPYGTEDKGWRRVEPYCYGLNKNDNMVLRAFQINGASDTPDGKPNDPLTKMPGWRMFRIDGIKNINFGGGDTFDEPRQGYNENDKDMKTIYRSVSFNTATNDTDALDNNDYGVPNDKVDNTDTVKPDNEKSPTNYDGDADSRLSDKPDWLKKFIGRFKQLVNYK